MLGVGGVAMWRCFGPDIGFYQARAYDTNGEQTETKEAK